MEKRLVSFTILTIVLIALCIVGSVLIPPIALLFLWLFVLLEGFIAWRLVFGFGFATYDIRGTTMYETKYSKDPTAPLYKYRYAFVVIWVILVIIFAIIAFVGLIAAR